ncbi:RNA pyrophosphohydrolase [Rhodobacteraceae bacterium 2CG4]|uniref:RNA pyrophosphohydrolase n=1 Tax=Halovulum marinum TaxID=2662447 RepID=A0A6L5Z8N3_9RHOB|nr:RNA pyrophosphohydrolase [Halovulum marinum]MSU92262.1 RNA pyrophosphohydrolase [Halovulum marinum]
MSELPYRPCVGVALCNADGLLFAGERIDTPGAWQMPQGGIDAGEQPLQAALREMEEEISVPASAVRNLAKTADWITYDLPDDLVGKVWGGRYRGQRQLWFLFRLQAPDGAVNLATRHPEFRTWRWMTPADMLTAIVPFKRQVYAAVLDEFAPHLPAAAAP